MITLIPLEKKHIPEIMVIERESFPEPWTQEMFEREFSTTISHFFVALSENALAGYAGYWLVSDEAHVVNLAVHPQFRARGIGRRMLLYLLSRAAQQGVRKVFLEVRRSNEHAQKLYLSEGFTVTGIRQKYYNNREDAFLMEKELT